ncbi:MAG: hypothetical protein ACRD3Q_11905, partial [Terriglobales bacterium]
MPPAHCEAAVARPDALPGVSLVRSPWVAPAPDGSADARRARVVAPDDFALADSLPDDFVPRDWVVAAGSALA